MGGVLQRYPRLRFCFAHGGGAFPFIKGRVEHGYNVRPDLCATDCSKNPSEFLGKFFTDSLVHDQAALDLLLHVIGEVCTLVSFLAWDSLTAPFVPVYFQDNIVLGTDYPFPLGELEPGRLIERSHLALESKVNLLCYFLKCMSFMFHRFQKKLLWQNALRMFNLGEGRFL